MNFIWQVEGIGIANIILTLSLITIFYLLLLFAFIKVCKRKAALLTLSISFVFVIFSYLFNLIALLIVVGSISATAFAVILFANLGDLRGFVAAPFKKSKVKTSKKNVISKIYDHQDLAKEIRDTVELLSKGKIGAIMTFERQNSLSDVAKNGVIINAPVSKELLQTIFYPGTRLHDGATIIHGNMIISAAVFFTPSTQPFAVKYGSRHRAAIGISEVCDAVTVVVSEETGRISIACNGELETVSLDNFLTVFENYMSNHE